MLYFLVPLLLIVANAVTGYIVYLYYTGKGIVSEEIKITDYIFHSAWAWGKFAYLKHVSKDGAPFPVKAFILKKVALMNIGFIVILLITIYGVTVFYAFDSASSSGGNSDHDIVEAIEGIFTGIAIIIGIIILLVVLIIVGCILALVIVLVPFLVANSMEKEVLRQINTQLRMQAQPQQTQ